MILAALIFADSSLSEDKKAALAAKFLVSYFYSSESDEKVLVIDWSVCGTGAKTSTTEHGVSTLFFTPLSIRLNGFT